MSVEMSGKIAVDIDDELSTYRERVTGLPLFTNALGEKPVRDAHVDMPWRIPNKVFRQLVGAYPVLQPVQLDEVSVQRLQPEMLAAVVKGLLAEAFCSRIF